MATIIAVHGTFAHAGSSNGGQAAEDARQWWQPGSQFEADMRSLLETPEDNLDIVDFTWSGDNSELGRRTAGRELLARMRELERRGEPYVLVGHSHGGSVIAAALLRAAARKEKLDNLKRWITIGTPFVAMKRETWLFTRLDLLRKVVFVASMMLLIMFLVYLVAQTLSGKGMVLGGRFPGILVATGVMMSLPALLFYLVLKYFDGRGLIAYRRRVTERARTFFGDRWLSLSHRDDEAIQGLSFLPGAKLFFFDKHFAVPTLTVLSVIALPMLYLWTITSAPTMVAIADWLKTGLYEARVEPGTEDAVRQIMKRRNNNTERTVSMSREERRASWQSYRQERHALEQKLGNIDAAERSLRFKQRFFERDDAICENGKLCGNGHDIRINSALLLHAVTDELSWLVGGEELGAGRNRWLWSAVLPAVLVPVLFGLVSLVLMLAIRAAAMLISSVTSSVLNTLTNAEVKRAAFGNDTEGEIAIGAVDRPTWLETSPPRLPQALAELVTEYSNSMATQSLAKFRRAIGQLASAEPKHTADTAITTYFTWKELVHSAYFDVPEFRKLVAQAIGRSQGFAPSATFKSDSDYARTAQWLAEIEGLPGTAAPPAAAPPGDKDKAAVSAVVASTVKAEP